MAIVFQWRDEPSGPTIQPGALVLSCFPSAGLAATVAAHYMMRAMSLRRVAVMDSDDAPPLALVQSGDVQPVTRVYGREDLALVVSEFPPTAAAAGPLARAILDGAERLKARMVLAVEGVVPHPLTEDGDGPGADAPEEQVWSVASRRDPKLEGWLGAAKTKQLTDGVIGGVSGALLVHGQRRSIPVAALLVSARGTEGYPDNRAAATLIEAIDRLVPEFKIDTAPLRTQAEVIERALRQAMKAQRGPNAPEEGPAPPPADVQTIYQ